MFTRKQIVECARSYLRTPFRHQGRLKGLGMDCVGLPICVARDLGSPVAAELLAAYRNYDPEPADDTVLRECRRRLIELAPDDFRPGNVLCMRVPVPCHTAIATELMGQVGIVHAYSGAGAVVEHNMDFQWLRRVAGVFMIPGTED